MKEVCFKTPKIFTSRLGVSTGWKLCFFFSLHKIYEPWGLRKSFAFFRLSDRSNVFGKNSESKRIRTK